MCFILFLSLSLSLSILNEINLNIWNFTIEMRSKFYEENATKRTKKQHHVQTLRSADRFGLACVLLDFFVFSSVCFFSVVPGHQFLSFLHFDLNSWLTGINEMR